MKDEQLTYQFMVDTNQFIYPLYLENDKIRHFQKLRHVTSPHPTTNSVTNVTIVVNVPNQFQIIYGLCDFKKKPIFDFYGDLVDPKPSIETTQSLPLINYFISRTEVSKYNAHFECTNDLFFCAAVSKCVYMSVHCQLIKSLKHKCLDKEIEIMLSNKEQYYLDVLNSKYTMIFARIGYKFTILEQDYSNSLNSTHTRLFFNKNNLMLLTKNVPNIHVLYDDYSYEQMEIVVKNFNDLNNIFNYLHEIKSSTYIKVFVPTEYIQEIKKSSCYVPLTTTTSTSSTTTTTTTKKTTTPITTTPSTSKQTSTIAPPLTSPKTTTAVSTTAVSTTAVSTTAVSTIKTTPTNTTPKPTTSSQTPTKTTATSTSTSTTITISTKPVDPAHHSSLGGKTIASIVSITLIVIIFIIGMVIYVKRKRFRIQHSMIYSRLSTSADPEL